MSKGDRTKADEFEPVALLTELKAKALGFKTSALPERLPLSAITQLPELFQPRGISERHVSELVRAIKNNGVVDPVLVIQVGPEAVLIDGHHRVAAYAAAGVTENIPVRYFEGTLDQAVLKAGQANSKAKLTMTSQERQDYAWRLELMGHYSKAEIAEASGVSRSQVAIMRRVKRALGDSAYDCPHWWQATRVLKGHEVEAPLSDAELEQMKEEKALRYADRLSKEFGTKLADNPEIAARALAIYFGRRFSELFDELRDHLPETDEDDFADDF